VWRLESWTHNGKERDDGVKAGRLTFRGNRVQIALMNPASDDVLQERAFRYFSVNPAKSPAEINLYGTNFLVQGIYKLEGHKLTLAMYGRPEIGRPRGFTMADAQPDRQTTGPLAVLTFRRLDGSRDAPPADNGDDYREGVDPATDDHGSREGPVSPAAPFHGVWAMVSWEMDRVSRTASVPAGRFWASVRPDAWADQAAPGFFGVVLAEANPLTFDVVQPEPAVAAEPSEAERPAG
jgi:uncharacterized protein (TIGR03067 family)